jgi:hypothetical protein
MLLGELKPLVEGHLARVGFNPQKPSVALAWAVFRRTVIEPMQGDPLAGVWVRGGLAKASLFRFSLVRCGDNDAEGWLWELRFHFTCRATRRLRDAGFRREYASADDRLGDFLFGLDRAADLHAILAHPGPWRYSSELVNCELESAPGAS